MSKNLLHMVYNGKPSSIWAGLLEKGKKKPSGCISDETLIHILWA